MTDEMNPAAPENPVPRKPKPQIYIKSRHVNLVRTPAGVYFVHAKVGGKLIHKSLKTDIESIAIQKRDLLIAQKRKEVGHLLKLKTAMRGMFDAFLEKSRSNTRTKPRTKHYHEEAIRVIIRHWPGVEEIQVSKVTAMDVAQFFNVIRKNYSATRYNSVLFVLRGCFQLAVELVARFDNPCAHIQAEPVRCKRANLPTSDELKLTLDTLRATNLNASQLVDFLLFSGARITETGMLLVSDVDFGREQIRFRSETTKNNEDRYVPFIKEMEGLLLDLTRDKKPSDPLLPIKGCLHVLRRVAAKLGLEPLTHHTLRHLFATRCIEQGVDIPTVARWMGHKDGGNLLMKLYSHLRDDHSKAMAGKVSFFKKPPESPATSPTNSPGAEIDSAKGTN